MCYSVDALDYLIYSPRIVSVSDLLYKRNQVEAVGGCSYLAQLAGDVVSARKARTYSRIIKEKADLRRLICRLANSAKGAQASGVAAMMAVNLPFA